MADKGTVVGNATIKVTPTMDDQAVSDLEKKGKSSGEKSGHFFGDAFKVAAGNLISSAVQNIASAATAVFKDAFGNYANYEQLVGGVDTLFKTSSGKVQQYAANAYATAGMSANQYMEQVTSFSASLLQGLGDNTEAAADYADMAMTDMSDNANKMGTSMESITNAYQGFAKQNYTMLDNLKLGYGGTKTEMERLLKDASAIAGVEFNIENYQDVIQAIHVMQTSMDISGLSVDSLKQKLADQALSAEELGKVAKSMGITYEEAARRMAEGTLTANDAEVLLGTTALEATKTIEGSLNMTKAAWSNFMTGLFDESADLGDLADKLVTSASFALGNVVPRIGVLVKRAVLQLPEGVSTAIRMLPQLVEPTIKKVFGDELGNQILESFGASVDKFLSGASRLWEGLRGIFDSLKSGVELVVSSITSRVELGGASIEGFIGGVIDFLTGTLFPTVQSVIDTVAPIVANVVGLVMDAMPTIQSMVGDAMNVVCSVVDSTMTAVNKVMSRVWPAIRGIVMTAVNAIRAVTQVTWPAIQAIITQVMNAISAFMDNVWPHIQGVIDSVMDAIQGIMEAVWPHIQGIIDTVMKTISGFMENDWPKIQGIVSTAMDAIKGVIDVAWPAIQFVIDGVMGAVKGIIETAWNAITGIISVAVAAISGIIDGISSIVGVVSGVFDSVRAAIENPINSAVEFLRGIPDQIIGFFSGLGSMITSAIGSISFPTPHVTWEPLEVFGMDTPVNLPHVTWYATGGIVDGATLIGAGEAGPEMILPKQGAMMDDFADAVARRGDDMLIKWLDRNLGPIISEYAPSMTKREFGRLARGTV